MLLAVCAIGNLIAQNYNNPLIYSYKLGVVIITKRRITTIVQAFPLIVECRPPSIVAQVAGAVSLPQPVSSSYRWQVICRAT
jgi:hypothetical protein